MTWWLNGLMLAAGLSGAAHFIWANRREEATFRDLLRGLTFGPNPDEVLRRIAERSARLVGGIAAYIERIDFDRDEITMSISGANCRHEPHPSDQTSTSTGTSDCNTSVSKLASVNVSVF